MQIHQLKGHSSRRPGKHIGRGGKRGTTAGKGTKGQKARAGRKLRPELRDLIKRLPKMRGYRFSGFTAKPATVNVSVLDRVFDNGAEVNPIVLQEKGLIKGIKGKLPEVKILATGSLAKKITVSGCSVSATAKEKIEKAGGTVK